MQSSPGLLKVDIPEAADIPLPLNTRIRWALRLATSWQVIWLSAPSRGFPRTSWRRRLLTRMLLRSVPRVLQRGITWCCSSSGTVVGGLGEPGGSPLLFGELSTRPPIQGVFASVLAVASFEGEDVIRDSSSSAMVSATSHTHQPPQLSLQLFDFLATL